VKKYPNIRYWCEDESRLGLITLWARKLTGKGIQPIGTEQWCFDYFWLYGLIEPKTGESFFAEFSPVDGICFQEYLRWFSARYPNDLHMIQVDNGRLHTWSELEIPENIILLFQLPTQPEFNSGWNAAVHSAPPYCPQVNPIERLWKEIKKQLKWELFDHLDELRKKLAQVLSNLTPSVVASVTGWDFILEALFVAGI